MFHRLAHICALALIFGVLIPAASIEAQVFDTDVNYTTSADFDLGTLVSVNHDTPDQLQLDSPTEPFPFINVAASGRGTVVRVNTETGEVVGEYRTAPEERGLDPSRTTVDLFGNVWTANRGETGEIGGIASGSAVKIGLIVGGTRVDLNASPDPQGGYLAPPFGYNTCIDRDNDGLIRTSAGLLDALSWPDVTDGIGGTDGLVQDAEDECVLVYQRLPDAEQARHVSVDADNNVWVGGYPFDLRHFYKLDGSSGAILDSFDADDIGCGGYGGLIDGNGVLWSIGNGWGEGPLLRYDPSTGVGTCVNTFGGYGLGIDTNGYLWASLWDNGIAKVSPAGVLQPGFPKSTWPTSSTITGSVSPLLAAPSLLPVAFSLQAPLPGTPSFQVSPMDNWVMATGPWAPEATIALTIEDGGTPVYTESQTSDGDGFFGFHFEFDLQRGHVVRVSDGATTEEHTVLGLFVDTIDLTNDDVSGRAVIGSDLDVWVDGSEGLTVTPDGVGVWTADFSDLTDITSESRGGAQQYDTNGNSTYVWWAQPSFQVSPRDNWVQSTGPWTAGATISLTVEDADSVLLYEDSQTATVDGFFNMQFEFDLQRGHVVTVSDGSTTKTHTVIGLYVDAIDTVFDTLSGRALTGSDVHVWVDGFEGLSATPDGTGAWTADFGGVADITSQSSGGAQQYDIDGDSTYVWWAQPSFWVAPDDNWVQSMNPWTPGATISLTIADSGGVVHADSQAADPAGNFNFNLWEASFQLERGHMVTVSDGTTTKTHTVLDLYVDGVNVAADTVFGRAAASTDVEVWVHGNGNATATADGSGVWTADFGGLTDLTYLSDGGSQQFDEDGDATGVWWASPSFLVAPDDNWVQSMTPWTPGATISLTIEDSEGVVHADSQAADSAGNFNFNLWEASFQLERGHIVTVSDGTTTKTHTVLDLYVDGVDVGADTVFGRGAADTAVEVWVHDDFGTATTTTADSGGNWTADFDGLADLTYGSDGGSQQADEDGDATGVWWASPSFQVQPNRDWIGSWNRWTPDTLISVTIDADDDPENGTLYSATTTSDTSGDFGVELSGVFNIERGMFVTVSDGVTTKTHQVLDLFITDMDVALDKVLGTAAPNSDVEVQVHGSANVWRNVTSDASGDWEADFSVVTGEGDGLADLHFSSQVSANQYDDDRDVTWVDRRAPEFRVNPDNEQIWGSNWVANSPVTIQVDDDLPATPPLYGVAASTNEWGDLNISEWDFDLLPGHVVTISDGSTTKTHTITDPEVTLIDTTGDSIAGVAPPGATVEVNVSNFVNGSSRTVGADSGTGMWSVDFSLASQDQPAYDVTDATRIDVAELDDDGDATTRQFGPPTQANRGVAITAADNHVWVASSGIGAVTRLDNDGNVLKIIDTGDEPTGVAVDASGKVWVTNQFSDNAVRVDPTAGTDGLGAVDMTVELGEGASPYNYSDMTGAVVVGSTSPQGFWTVVQDSGEDGFEWGRVTWNTEPEAREPSGTEIVVEARTADSEAGLGGAVFAAVTNGSLFSSFGRFIEVRVTLKASPEGLGPVLSDIRVQPAMIEVELDIKPGSYPNSINIKRTTGVVPVAVLGGDDFDVATIDGATMRFGSQLALPAHDLTDLATYLDHLEDVNGDGYVDLVSHYVVGHIGLASGDTEACLVGETLSGIPIEGCDSVRILGK